jgi:hypothetical protein
MNSNATDDPVRDYFPRTRAALAEYERLDQAYSRCACALPDEQAIAALDRLDAAGLAVWDVFADEARELFERPVEALSRRPAPWLRLLALA